jgi:3-oxoadipate enol-lactonase
MTEPVRHDIQVASGVTLAVTASGHADAPALLFSNSLGADQGMWAEVLSHLGDRYRVVTYDARGHGHSSIPDGPYTVAMLADDIAAIARRLELGRFHVCGLSLGGVTAMQLALAHPHIVNGLILANTSAGFAPAQMWTERAAITRKGQFGGLIQPTLQRWLSASFQKTHPKRTASVTTMIAATSVEGYAGCCEALAAADLWDELARIKAPTRVIVGEHDPSTTPAIGARIAAAIPGADLISLDAAHLSCVEQPAAFAKAIIGFIEAKASQAAA